MKKIEYYIEFGDGGTEYKKGTQKEVIAYCKEKSKSFTLYDTEEYPEYKKPSKS